MVSSLSDSAKLDDPWPAIDCDLEVIRKTIRRNGDERKLRLYLCGGCRCISGLFFRAESLRAVEIAERFADQKATIRELEEAEWAAESPTFGYEFDEDRFAFDHPYKADVVLRLVEMGVLPSTTKPGDKWYVDAGARTRLLAAAELAEYAASTTFVELLPEHEVQLASYWSALPKVLQVRWPGKWMLQCVYGTGENTQASHWKSERVLTIAKNAYQETSVHGEINPAHMRMLAEELESATCDDQLVLAHLRERNHVRGCWVLDAFLQGTNWA